MKIILSDALFIAALCRATWSAVFSHAEGVLQHKSYRLLFHTSSLSGKDERAWP